MTTNARVESIAKGIMAITRNSHNYCLRVAYAYREADPLTAEHDKLKAVSQQMREALAEILNPRRELITWHKAQESIAAYDALEKGKR